MPVSPRGHPIQIQGPKSRARVSVKSSHVADVRRSDRRLRDQRAPRCARSGPRQASTRLWLFIILLVYLLSPRSLVLCFFSPYRHSTILLPSHADTQFDEGIAAPIASRCDNRTELTGDVGDLASRSLPRVPSQHEDRLNCRFYVQHLRHCLISNIEHKRQCQLRIDSP